MITDAIMPYDQMQKCAARQICGECGGRLNVCWGGAHGHNGYVLRCGNDINHTTLAREGRISLYDNPGVNYGTLDHKRRIELVTKYGDEKAAALAPYHGTAALTEVKAREIITTIWPKTPAVEITKAALICNQYGLNPLMKHVFLVPFDTKSGMTWAVVLGIKASRLIAARQGQYSYLDDTPRLMSEAEQIKIFGEIDNSNICAITRLRDANGNVAQGYGKWPKNNPCYGADKGNSKFNMACIRSERAAFDRLFPGAMPADVAIVDEQFVEDTGRVIDVQSGEVVADGVAEVSDQVETPSKQETMAWDNIQSASVKTDPVINNLGDLLTACFNIYKLKREQVYAELNVKDGREITDVKKAWEYIKASRAN